MSVLAKSGPIGKDLKKNHAGTKKDGGSRQNQSNFLNGGRKVVAQKKQKKELLPRD